MSDQKTTRCTHCGTEFTEKELEGVYACPICKTTGVPCSIAEDVTIKINWHELRILGIWADNYAQSMPPDQDGSKQLVGKIIQRIEAQYPDMTSLTLGGEIRKLQETYPSMTLMRGDGETLIPPKEEPTVQ